jgi:uncharacterized damage-inducible protein DinB
MDASLERLYDHMAWANRNLFSQLLELPESALAVTQPQSQWSVGEIVVHIVNASRAYCVRLEGQPRPEPFEPVRTHEELRQLADVCADVDARLKVQAADSEGTVTFTYDGQQITRKRMTLVSQSIHHATEHRVHIADALAAAGTDVIDLDEMDLWSYGEKVGGGA